MKNNTGIIVASIVVPCALILFFAVIFISQTSDNDHNSLQPLTTSTTSTHESDTSIEVIAPTAPQMENEISISTQRIPIPSTTERRIVAPTTTRKPETTKTPPADTNRTLIPGATYTVNYTPSGAGLVLRSKPTSSSEKLDVIPEGTRVYVYSDNSSNNTDYVYVSAYLQYSDLHGYVLKKYLVFEKESTQYTDSNTRYVSYSTPDHAGINLRSQPNSSSQNIYTILEGDVVQIVEPYNSSNNGYVRVSYNHPCAGETWYGWVLYNYLVR